MFTFQESDDAIKKSDEIPADMKVAQMNNDEPDCILSKGRPEIPHDSSDPPSFIINHNAQHSGAPPSPFPYHTAGHSRIRTESLCSIKSNRDITVANYLQPRKIIRTEDQKIIDIKRESRERLSNKDLDRTQLRMFDMIYFNPMNNPMKPRSPQKTEKPRKVDLNLDPSPVKKEPTAMPVPQLRLNANGEMVLDETSLVVENEQQKQNRILLASTNVVYDDDLSGNGYYKRQQRTKEWLHDETVKFYRCLNTVGTDFSLMLNLFPLRTRRDLKLKFKKEEKDNPMLINKALLNHNTFDLDELQRELDEEEEERRKEAEAKSNSEVKELVKRKILKKQEAKLKAQEQSKTRIEKILSEGELALSIVDHSVDVKENLETKPSTSAAVRTKRPYKRKVKVDADPLEAEMAEVKKKSRQPRKKVDQSDILNALEPSAKRPRKVTKKQDALVVQEISRDIDEAIEKLYGNDEAVGSFEVEQLSPPDGNAESSGVSMRIKDASFNL